MYATLGVPGPYPIALGAVSVDDLGLKGTRLLHGSEQPKIASEAVQGDSDGVDVERSASRRAPYDGTRERAGQTVQPGSTLQAQVRWCMHGAPISPGFVADR